MSSGKLFQTFGAACEKARPTKARLVRSSCSRFLPQDRKPLMGISPEFHQIYSFGVVGHKDELIRG